VISSFLLHLDSRSQISVSGPLNLVGTLAWLANWTRPELAFAVPKFQRSQSNPEPKHFEAAERAFRYLKGTQSERLRLGGDLVLRAYTDSDFCQDKQ